LTVTTTTIGVPLHPLAAGVIVYVAVPEVTPSVLVSNWLITDPLPPVAPVTLLVATVQLNVVPATLAGVGLMITLVVCPEQIDKLLALAVGTGFTVTT
jgi:hypothetical protein